MDRLAAQYVTAGGQTVDLRYRRDRFEVLGVSAQCTGCHATAVCCKRCKRTVVGEVAAHEWAHEHAVRCTRRP
ncbi:MULTISPECIES: hypothetical protein [Streptomyces]|uniref:hypothetical protein n=1 Tax=Streptomyces lycopersici TaxID=2974589 RepID=UPI0021D1DA25|nr:hypothetical protein [Streptomyces sp. NEAU-383]